MADCLFDAFYNGLKKLDQLPAESDIDAIRTAFDDAKEKIGGVDNRDITREQYLNWLKDDDHKKNSAKVLRALAVKYINDNYDDAYKDQYHNRLMGAYDAFLQRDPDDDFCSHEHIKKKFKELKNEFDDFCKTHPKEKDRSESLDKQKKALIEFWDSTDVETGRLKYFKELMTASDGSDIEADALGTIFHIRIHYVGTVNKFGGYRGEPVSITDEQTKKALLDRGLVSKGIGGIQNVELRNTLSEVDEKFDAVPHYTEIYLFLEKKQSELGCEPGVLISKKDINDAMSPQDFRKLVQILDRRGVVSHKECAPNEFRINIESLDDFDMRCEKLSDKVKKNVKDMYDEAQKLPVIILNHSPGHWTFLDKDPVRSKEKNRLLIPIVEGEFNQERIEELFYRDGTRLTSTAEIEDDDAYKIARELLENYLLKASYTKYDSEKKLLDPKKRIYTYMARKAEGSSEEGSEIKFDNDKNEYEIKAVDDKDDRKFSFKVFAELAFFSGHTAVRIEEIDNIDYQLELAEILEKNKIEIRWTDDAKKKAFDAKRNPTAGAVNLTVSSPLTPGKNRGT